MSELKDSWKKTGTSIGHAFRDLGKSLIITGKAGMEKATEWSEKEDGRYVNTTVETVSETPADY